MGVLFLHPLEIGAYTGLKESFFHFSYLLGGIVMPDKIMPGPVSECGNVREAVCIHTRKIYDSCRE